MLGRLAPVLLVCPILCCSASIHASSQSDWYVSYAEAFKAAKRESKMLLIWFDGQSDAVFGSETLSNPEVVEKLKEFIKVRLPLDASVQREGVMITLLGHDTFSEMLGLPGLVIVDLAHKGASYYGSVVSTFPFADDRVYTSRETLVILGLSPGTLTQRTLIYAVRVHPDRPASTQGKLDPYLVREASRSSECQARLCLQGHHNWSTRFHKINAKLPEGTLAVEVCAESWPGERLLEAAIECVHCWRLSSGHWRTVRTRHPVYGYDMKRGSNAVWYATGIFGRR